MGHHFLARPLRCATVVVAIGLSTATALQAAPVDVPDDTADNIVTVAGHHYDNAVGTSDAASEGSVDGALLQDRPILRPGEVLETIPGLVVAQHSADGKANQYFLRGYNLDHGTDFAMGVDGVPVNMPTSAHGQGYSDLNFLIPELVERMDYRKGTYFAENGDFSAAGSADIHTRNALDQSIADITLGPDQYRRALLAGSTALPSGGPQWLGALELLEENGPWTPPENLRKLNLLGKVSDGTRRDGWSADAVVYDAHWNAVDQVPLALIESGALGRYQAVDPTDGGATGRAILSAEGHQRDQSGYTRWSAWLEHYRLQLWSNFTIDELRPATGDQFEQTEARNITGGRLVHGWNQQVFGVETLTEAGVQLRHDQIHVSLLDTENRVPFHTVSDDRIGETAAGVYLQTSTSWVDWLRSVVGVRADQVQMDLTSINLPVNSGSASASRISPKLALTLGPWQRTEFFVDYGEGFHSNDARGVIGRIDPTTLTPSQAVPALVGAIGKELGVRSEFIPGLQSSLALWHLRSASELVYNQDSTIGSTSANGASVRSGIEWNNHMVMSDHVLFDADLAWTRARYATMNDNGQTGDAIPNSVGRVASIGLTANGFGVWSGEINVRYVGPYPLSQDGALRAPSAIVTNLRVQRQIGTGMTVSASVLNLFNRQYFDIAYEQDYRVAQTVATVPDGITVHPGEPRELRVTMAVRF